MCCGESSSSQGSGVHDYSKSLLKDSQRLSVGSYMYWRLYFVSCVTQWLLACNSLIVRWRDAIAEVVGGRNADKCYCLISISCYARWITLDAGLQLSVG